ncbi:FliH/SctL family protein [Stakelama saccharophila]|uniref:FliH/SctL family protein n=1 Tax=Stakelama saccharophila TaxID=3075605 RepID=A0ABZ0B9G3_9SPHN|nr:FliH/SctL family protein [Stakelama sp. W311]WNO53695.1 FliH/SctL family protein [Stakelama sp. W311]
MSDFLPGFAGRHDDAATALDEAFSSGGAFAPSDIGSWVRDSAPPSKQAAPQHFEPQNPEPRHFSPANPECDPTEGWDPFDPELKQDGEEAAEFVDPVAAAHDAGFAEGRAAAMADLTQSGARDRELLSQLQVALAQGPTFDQERIARRIRETVLLLVRRIVGDVGVAGDLLLRRIEAAAELLADGAESAMLRLHPDDVPLVEGTLPKNVFPVGDSNIERGSFLLESVSTVVEDGPELWLEQLAAALEQVAVPPKC